MVKKRRGGELIQLLFRLNPGRLRKIEKGNSAILLRFVSKRGTDFNAISTGFSTIKRPVSGQNIVEIEGNSAQHSARVRNGVSHNVMDVKFSYRIHPTQPQLNQIFP